MYKRLFVLCFVSAMTITAVAMSTLDSLLTVFYDEVSQTSVYCERHQRKIDSLCHIRPMTHALEIQIAREYQYFQSDSARVWYMRLMNAEEPYRTQAYTGLVQLASSIGKYADGMILLPDIKETPDSLRVNWIEAIWRLHTEALANTEIPALREQLATTAQFYYDSLLREMDSQAPYSVSIRLKRLEWLVRSARADVGCGITDNGSCWLVAKECYESGDLERAYHFSNYSLTNASFFNAPTRFIQTYSLGHNISNSYEQRLQKSSAILTIALIALAVVLAIVIIAVLFAWRQNRRLHSLNREMNSMNEQLRSINRQLRDSDKVKEQYICRYLEVYSDYIRRLTTMARKAGEKDSAAFMDREMENFYRSFDDTFLSLYGSFVQDFNALLKPESRITPKPGERMTVEMRIFALILLGITSSAKIAELLCYSPNTISNYRVKMKNAAAGNRDTFEDRVRQIGN